MEDNGNIPSGSGPANDQFVLGDEFSNISPPKKSCDCLKNGLMIAALVAGILLLSYIPFSVYMLDKLEKNNLAYEKTIILSDEWYRMLKYDTQILLREERITYDEYAEIQACLQEFDGSILGVQVFNSALTSLLAGTKITNGLDILYCRFMAITVEDNLRTLLKKEAELDKLLTEFKKRGGKKQECFFFRKIPYFLPV